MSKFITNQSFSFLLNGVQAKAVVILGLIIMSMMSTSHAYGAWYERFMVKDDTYQNETYKVKEADGDEVFVIDNYIYDARSFCQLSVGDQVFFAEGRHGVDYRATVYNLKSQQRCELLLRDPVS